MKVEQYKKDTDCNFKDQNTEMIKLNKEIDKLTKNSFLKLDKTDG